MGRMRAGGWVALVIGVLVMVLPARAAATPLYGGYNGESALWIEYKIGEFKTPLFTSSIIFGSDIDERSWMRMRIALVPFFTRLELTLDYLDIQSVVFGTLFPWPVQLGTEIDVGGVDDPRWWVTSYLLLGVGGIDSEGNSWTETGVPGVYGVGTDISGNWWRWVKVGNLLWGIGEDFAMEPGTRAGDAPVMQLEESLLFLHDRFDEYAGHKLAKRLNSAPLISAAEECSFSLLGAGAHTSFSRVSPRGLPAREGIAIMNQSAYAACNAVSAELLAGGPENDLPLLLEDFVQAVGPLLRTWASRR